MSKLHVLTNDVRTEIDSIMVEEISEAITSTFNAIANYNTKWHDDKNSDNFADVVKQYQSKVTALAENLAMLKQNIDKDMERYDGIESLAEGW